MNQISGLTTDDTQLGEIVDEILSAMGRGEMPDLEAYARENPEIADILRQALPALRAVAESTGETRVEMSGVLQAKTLGDFRIRRELGRGGMGVVYEADQISLGRRVALKVLPFAGMVQEKALQRFQNEVRAAATFEHLNIVSVYSIGEDRGVHYYAMQLIHGQPLSKVITELAKLRQSQHHLDADSIHQSLSRHDVREEIPDSASAASELTEEFLLTSNGRQPSANTTCEQAEKTDTLISSRQGRDFFRSAAELGIQAANALDHAHEHGVLHRDIKPGNLMLDAEARLYVTDFGLARIQTDTSMTMTGDLMGTLRYMSPEQALANRTVIDGRSDIYSLGATLYELVALRPAFATTNRQELLRKIAFEEPTKLRDIDRSIPHELETIIHKAIEKSPDDRYASAAELAEDLQAFLEDRAIRAKPPTLTERGVKWARRHRSLVWTMGFSGCLLVLITVFGLSLSNLLIAQERRVAQEQTEEAELQAAVANAVIQYITKDLLGAPMNEPDRDIRLRTVVDRAADQIEAKLADQPLVAAMIRQTIGETYRALGEYKKAEQHLRKSLVIFQQQLGVSHRTTQECQRELANTLLDLGQDAESERLHREIFDARLKELGDRDPDTLQSMSDLGELSEACGFSVVARRLLTHVAEIRQEQLGGTHPLTLDAQNILAQILVSLGETKQAEQMLQTVLEARERVLGNKHPDTLESRYRLASVFLLRRESEHAQGEFRGLLELATETLGASHPFTLHCVTQLAATCTRLGEFAESHELSVKALTAAEQTIGSEHPQTLEIRFGLASNDAARGDFVTAERHYMSVLQTLRETHGEYHPFTTATKLALQETYATLGQNAKAELLRESLERADPIAMDYLMFGWHQPFSHRERQRLESLKNRSPDDKLATRALNGMDATLINGTEFVGGKPGQALHFDGVDDRAIIDDVPGLAFTESMTIEAWIRADSLPTSQAGHGLIVMRGDNRGGLDPYFLTTLPTGEVQFGVTSLEASAAITAAIPLQKCVHVAGTLDDPSGDMRLYVDGVLQAETRTEVRPFRDLAPDRNPGIGIGNHAGRRGHNFPFHGLIEQLHIHDSALSPESIQNIVRSGGKR